MRRLYRSKDAVEFRTTKGCIFRLDNDGKYSTDIVINEKKYPLVRYLYIRFVDNIPKGMKLKNTCGNEHCVNQAHYMLVSGDDGFFEQDDVVMKMDRRTRNVKIGSAHPLAKLDETKVRDIKTSGLTRRELSVKYGVSLATISNILTGKIWGHVTTD